jgi:formate--tetrahydrofolate ligase
MVRTYELTDGIKTKIEKIATRVYGARGVTYSEDAETQIRSLEKRGYARLPICVAKTQFSLSDDPKLKGRPENFEATVREVEINSGAGFVVVLMGEIFRMPGLPKEPAAEGMGIDESGNIYGVF